MIEYEKIIIGHCINNIDFYQKAKVEKINSRMFKGKMQMIWEAIESVAVSKGLSPLIVTDYFKPNNKEQKQEKLLFLEMLSNNNQNNIEDFYHAITKLKERLKREQIISVRDQINAGLNGNENSDNILNDIIEAAIQIDNSSSNIIESNSVEIVEKTKIEIQKRIDGEIENGVKSGIRTIDEEIDCFYYSLFTIIIARPGHGKTTFMINTFVNNIENGEKPVFFSLEMPSTHLLIKMLGIKTKIAVNKIFKPQLLTPEEKNKIYEALDFFMSKEFYIVDATSMTVIEFGTLLAKYTKIGCNISYLDYIQLLRLPNGNMPEKAAEFRIISKETREILRVVNRFNDMALVAAAQAGRSVEQRPIEKRIPTQSDLEWSSSLEQDAAAIIGLMNREAYEKEECEFKNQIFVGFPKHRYQGTFSKKLAFMGDIQYLTDLNEADANETQLNYWQESIRQEELEMQNKMREANKMRN